MLLGRYALFVADGKIDNYYNYRIILISNGKNGYNEIKLRYGLFEFCQQSRSPLGTVWNIWIDILSNMKWGGRRGRGD